MHFDSPPFPFFFFLFHSSYLSVSLFPRWASQLTWQKRKEREERKERRKYDRMKRRKLGRSERRRGMEEIKSKEREKRGGSLRFPASHWFTSCLGAARKKEDWKEERRERSEAARSREGGRMISAVCMRDRRQTLLNCPMTPYILFSEHAPSFYDSTLSLPLYHSLLSSRYTDLEETDSRSLPFRSRIP